MLCQLSSCHHNTSNKLVMELVVNIAFYKILRQHKSKLVSKIRLQVKTKLQVFDVSLFGDRKGPLDQPTHLKEIFSQLGDSGHREHPEIKVKTTEKPLLTKTQNNIMVITCTFLATLVCVGLVFLALRHVKLKALVTGLALVTAAPVTEVRGNQSPVTKQQLIIPDRVVCTEPVLTALATPASIVALITFVYMHCTGLTWLYGYKYDRYCTLYICV